MITLDLYRILDPKLLSQEAVEYFEKYEGSSEYVEADRARDVEWTEEVIAATAEYAIIGPDGDVLAKFPTLADAEKARANAKITFSIDLEDEDEEED